MKQGLGIRLPIQMGQLGFFEQTYTTLEEARSSLINLIKTRKGERIMHPDFGTNIYSLLFEPMTRTILDTLESEIKTSIDYWIPYIEIGEIKINATDELIDKNQIEIYITYGLKQDITKFDKLTVVYQF